MRPGGPDAAGGCWQVHTLVKGLEKIAASADIPMLVAGDFNSTPGSAAHSLLVKHRVESGHAVGGPPRLALYPPAPPALPPPSSPCAPFQGLSALQRRTAPPTVPLFWPPPSDWAAIDWGVGRPAHSTASGDSKKQSR